MDNIIQLIEIFAFITGLAYIILEIKQKNVMWYLGIATGAACAFSFGVQHLYASMGLNIYYIFVSFWGLYQWKNARRCLDEAGRENMVHLNRISSKVVIVSAAIFVLCTAALILLLEWTGDSESSMDAIVTVLSAVATYWLAKSYIQQWLLWIVADILSGLLCLTVGMYWMAVLYLFYTLSAVYGYYYWNQKGVYIRK